MTHLNIINAIQGHIHEYENTKRKLYNCNANIYFNRQCLQNRKQLFCDLFISYIVLYIQTKRDGISKEYFEGILLCFGVKRCLLVRLVIRFLYFPFVTVRLSIACRFCICILSSFTFLYISGDR